MADSAPDASAQLRRVTLVVQYISNGCEAERAIFEVPVAAYGDAEATPLQTAVTNLVRRGVLATHCYYDGCLDDGMFPDDDTKLMTQLLNRSQRNLGPARTGARYRL